MATHDKRTTKRIHFDNDLFRQDTDTSTEHQQNNHHQNGSGSHLGLFQDFDLTAKIMMVGDSSVGKTCLLVKFKDGTFLSGSFICTVGIDFRNKIVDIDKTKIKLQIWDTAGQERFRSITRAYYRDAEALLLVYDISNRQTFENIRNWLTEAHEYAKSDVIMMLLGNKADLTNQRQVKTEEGQRLADEANIEFMETSAKSGQNVDLAFTAIARTLKDIRLAESTKLDSRSSLKRYISTPEHSEPILQSTCSC